MPEASVFTSNRSQAVRLPKAAEFPPGTKRVVVTVVGKTRVIAPAGESWDAFFAETTASPDFMSDRAQPDAQQRESL